MPDIRYDALSTMKRVTLYTDGQPYEETVAEFEKTFLEGASPQQVWEMFAEVHKPVILRLYNLAIHQNKMDPVKGYPKSVTFNSPTRTGGTAVDRTVSKRPRVSGAALAGAVGSVQESRLRQVYNLKGTCFAVLRQEALRAYAADETTPLINRAYARILVNNMPNSSRDKDVAERYFTAEMAEELYQEALRQIRDAA